MATEHGKSRPLVAARWCWALAALAALDLPAAAAAELGPILITTPRLERKLLDTPAAVDRVGEREVQQGRAGLTLDESLRQVPGLFFQNQYNFAQGLRISTRGFGARAPFGIRGIHLRVDGFPATLPDGQSQTDGIALEAARSIEVIRGPAAVAYGNAAGGVIDVTTADGSRMARSPVVALAGGSHGYRSAEARFGGSGDDWTHHVSLSALELDGYREQSHSVRRRLNAKLTRSVGDHREIQGVITLLDNPESEDPGGLTAGELAADREAAAPNALALDSGQEVEQQRLGLRWRDERAGGGALTLRGFYTRRDFEQQLPFPGSSLLGFERDYAGLAVDYTRATSIAGMALRGAVGGDLGHQVDDRFRFAVDASGNVTGQTADEIQRATATGLFAQGDLDVNERLDLSAGLRLDRVRFEIDDELTADGDDSGARDFEEASGALGALYTLVPGHRAYANVSTAFETPTFTEFADPDGSGGFNPDIEPQQALNREIGARGRFDRLRYDIAVFRVDVDDEIVPFERDGREFFENAARTRREGIEVGIDWIAGRNWTLAAAWTASDFRFERFVDREGNDFAGNRLPGLPRHQLYLEADWQDAAGRYARLETRLVDEVYADNANRVEVDGYGVLNARLGRGWTRSGGRRLDAWVGVDNLTGEEYIANVRINAGAGRFFEPAPERTFRFGLEVGF